MDAKYLSKLVHPLHKTPLEYDEKSDRLLDTLHNESFSVTEHVPILLTAAEEDSLTETKQHNEAGGKFHYKEHYQVDAETYDYFKEPESAAERVEHTRLHDYILSQIPKNAEWVLDTGCGGGWLAKSLQHSGKQVISMDITPINPIKATKDTPYASHYGLVADVFELPLHEGSIDCIVASEIIEHVSDPGRFIRSLFTALKPGGRLIITTPYNEQIQSSLCIHCNHLTPHNAHLHSFTEKSIRGLVPANAKTVKTKVFNNKILVRLGIQRMLSFLPLSIWTAIDDLCNAVTGKRSYRLMLVVNK
jgi:2-polyprenyl-3-methyl-5-hydroxy-6-metoxy-1,4-benzoquinol methylase